MKRRRLLSAGGQRLIEELHERHDEPEAAENLLVNSSRRDDAGLQFGAENVVLVLDQFGCRMFRIEALGYARQAVAMHFSKRGLDLALAENLAQGLMIVADVFAHGQQHVFFGMIYAPAGKRAVV